MNAITDFRKFARKESPGVAGRLQVDLDQRDRAVVVQACGEVDAYTLSAWRRIIEEATAHVGASQALIIDATRLEFIAWCALAALGNQADACRECGIEMFVVSRASIVHRIVAATDLSKRLSIYPSSEDALATCSRFENNGASA